MTGDWAGFVQILRSVDVCEVPVVVLNNINLIVKTFDDVDNFIPSTVVENGDRKSSPTPCQLGKS